MSETTVTGEPLVVEETETKPGFIGVNQPRKEDKRLVQGAGVFVDDVKAHGMAYVEFVRSPYAHAAITRIDVSPAMELEGVYGTLIGEDADFLCIWHGTHTLASYGGTVTSNPDCLRNLTVGQQQIQGSLGPLGREGEEGALRSRYVATLGGLEDRLAKLAEEEQRLKDEIAQMEGEATQRLAALTKENKGKR